MKHETGAASNAAPGPSRPRSQRVGRRELTMLALTLATFLLDQPGGAPSSAALPLREGPS